MKATIEVIVPKETDYAIVRMRRRSPYREQQWPTDVLMKADEMRAFALRLQKAAEELDETK